MCDFVTFIPPSNLNKIVYWLWKLLWTLRQKLSPDNRITSKLFIWENMQKIDWEGLALFWHLHNLYLSLQMWIIKVWGITFMEDSYFILLTQWEIYVVLALEIISDVIQIQLYYINHWILINSWLPTEVW